MPASRILLVEDDPHVRVLMEHVLTGDGYAVDLAGTVEAARTLLRNHKYDLAVVDGVLPDGSGIVVAEVAEALGIPAIVATAFAFRFPKRDLARFDLLLKPARPDELLAAVKSALRG